MIIDSHAHLVMPPESFRFMAELVGGRANPNTLPKIPEASVRKAAEELVRIIQKTPGVKAVFDFQTTWVGIDDFQVRWGDVNCL